MSIKRTVKERKQKRRSDDFGIGIKDPGSVGHEMMHMALSLNLDDLLDIPVFKDAVAEFEKIYLSHRLNLNNQNKHQTAQQMQYDRTALYKKLKKLNMDNFF